VFYARIWKSLSVDIRNIMPPSNTKISATLWESIIARFGLTKAQERYNLLRDACALKLEGSDYFTYQSKWLKIRADLRNLEVSIDDVVHDLFIQNLGLWQAGFGASATTSSQTQCAVRSLASAITAPSRNQPSDQSQPKYLPDIETIRVQGCLICKISLSQIEYYCCFTEDQGRSNDESLSISSLLPPPPAVVIPAPLHSLSGPSDGAVIHHPSDDGPVIGRSALEAECDRPSQVTLEEDNCDSVPSDDDNDSDYLEDVDAEVLDQEEQLPTISCVAISTFAGTTVSMMERDLSYKFVPYL
jgi:hypothetical protein